MAEHFWAEYFGSFNSTGHRRQLFLYLCLIGGLAVLLSGCMGERVRVLVPPLAPIGDINNIAILDFVNATNDPGIAIEFADLLGQVAASSGYFTVQDRASTAAVLAKLGITPVEATSPETAVRLGKALSCDVLITGEVTYYMEDIYVQVPYRIGSTSEGRSPNWYSSLNTNIHLTVQVRIINAGTGEIIWSKKVSESNEESELEVLTWHYDSPPPESLLPKLRRTAVPQVRAGVLEQAVDSFVKDLLPSYRYEWRRPSSQDAEN